MTSLKKVQLSKTQNVIHGSRCVACFTPAYGLTFNFQKNGVGRHFGFSPLAKNVGIFSRGYGFSIVYKRSIKLKSIVKVCQPENSHGIGILDPTIYILPGSVCYIYFLNANTNYCNIIQTKSSTSIPWCPICRLYMTAVLFLAPNTKLHAHQGNTKLQFYKHTFYHICHTSDHSIGKYSTSYVTNSQMNEFDTTPTSQFWDDDQISKRILYYSEMCIHVKNT